MVVWTHTEEWLIPPKWTVHKGDAVRIAGRRGDFRFHCVNFRDGEPAEVEVYGPMPDHELSRVFRPDQLRHSTKTPADVAGNAELHAVSMQAKRRRR